MKIDFSQQILGLGGEVSELTLANIAATALNAPSKEPMTLQEAARRGNLAIAVHAGGEIDIKPEDLTLIRSLLPLVGTPVLVARAAAMLE